MKDFGRHPGLLDSHVERVIAAHDAALGYMVDSPLRTVGLIQIENYLSERGGLIHPNKIAEEIIALPPGDAKRRDNVLTATPRNSVSRICADYIWHSIQRLFTNHLVEIANKFIGNFYLQHLYNTPEDRDEQKVFHSDTFFPAIKFWYFPQAVGRNDGPLMYVPNSPILTPQLLAWHQTQVDKIRRGDVEAWRGRGHKQGSLRISPEELASLGLQGTAVTVEPDTLVIANVFGFHCRGDATRPTHRLALHGSIRIDRPI